MTDARSRSSRRIRTALAVAALAIAGSGLTALPSYAEDLGGLDLDRACRDQLAPDWFPRLRGANNVYSWKCVWAANNDIDFGIDMQRACETEKGIPAHADFHDYNNPYSWYCWR